MTTLWNKARAGDEPELIETRCVDGNWGLFYVLDEDDEIGALLGDGHWNGDEEWFGSEGEAVQHFGDNSTEFEEEWGVVVFRDGVPEFLATEKEE